MRTVIETCDRCGKVQEGGIGIIYVQRGTLLSGYGNSDYSQILELCDICKGEIFRTFPVLRVFNP